MLLCHENLTQTRALFSPPLLISCRNRNRKVFVGSHERSSFLLSLLLTGRVFIFNHGWQLTQPHQTFACHRNEKVNGKLNCTRIARKKTSQPFFFTSKIDGEKPTQRAKQETREAKLWRELTTKLSADRVMLYDLIYHVGKCEYSLSLLF